jgi:hypothetical protein
MQFHHLLSYFFGGVFLMNAVPHLVSGVMGRPFQTPFAKPSGKGLSSSTVNVLWGFANLVIAYLLLCVVGDFSLHNPIDAVVFASGGAMIGLFSAWHFGRFYEGNVPKQQ